MKYGGALRFRSSTDANEEVITTLLMALLVAAAERMERTPLMAGRMSSFLLSVVSYVKGYSRGSVIYL